MDAAEHRTIDSGRSSTSYAIRLYYTAQSHRRCPVWDWTRGVGVMQDSENEKQGAGQKALMAGSEGHHGFPHRSHLSPAITHDLSLSSLSLPH